MNKYEPEMNKVSVNEEKVLATSSLPLPPLKDTVESFTQWFTPFLTNEQRAKTRTALNSFVKPGGLADRLQTSLAQYHENDPQQSWLDNYWTTRFLERRDPTAINDNFFFLFRPAELDRTKHAAALIAAALNYKLLLDQEQVPLAVKRTTPTCSKQIKNLFATTRIPGAERDRLQNYCRDNEPKTGSPRHIVVFSRRNIFQLELISADGDAHSLLDIQKGLEQIIDHSLEAQPDGRSVGHLTTLQRSDWAQTRLKLMANSQKNADNLELIESALFSVHLEDHKPVDNGEACDQLLRGNSGNRWYDKSLQFIIFNNGYAGLNVEHASLDRATIIDFLDYILGIDPGSIDQYSGATPQGVPLIKELAFDLPPAFQKKISRAHIIFEELKRQLVSNTFEYLDFDMELLAQEHISPDAFAQCALQLAHWRYLQKHAAVNQNISMRHYTNGRVQYMWLLTSEMIDFVADMVDEKKPEEEKFAAFKKATDQHQQRALNCRNGEMPEQHIEELLNIYHRNPQDFEPDFLSRLTNKGKLSQQEIKEALSLFKSPGWACMHEDAFNTSFLASPSILHHGFKSFDPDNIAIGCQVQNGSLHAYLCTGSKHEDMLVDFCAHWQQSLVDLQTLILENIDEPDMKDEDNDE